MKEKNKRQLIAALGIATGSLSAVAVATHISIYDKFFSRYERPDYSIKPGLFCYDLIKDKISREEIDYKSDDVYLKGYYYKAKRSKGLVIIAHGLHSGGDDYIPIILYLLKNHYSVFSFNYKGTYESGGDSTVGMCESLVDLDHTIDFINSDSRFKNMPLFLIGHSWGGYAVTSVLSIKTNIKACACISAINDGYTIIMEKGQQYAGNLSLPSKPFFDVYQRYLFKNYVDYNGLKGINESNIPVLVAHGVEDEVISFNLQSIIAYKGKITNPNVIYYIGKGLQGGHNSILHSHKAIIYQKEIESDIKLNEMQTKKEMNYSQKQEFNKTINHELYSSVNEELMDMIIDMFNKTFK